jgi:site-specific DNA-adenine methylase
MKTPIRYAGGKTKAKSFITPFVENYNKIISPFIGGGSLEVHWASMGNGETRIGKNRKELQMVNAKDSHEILIIKR